MSTVTATPEDVQFAFFTALAVGFALGALLALCIRKTRKPPMATRTTFFAPHGRHSNWQQPQRNR